MIGGKTKTTTTGAVPTKGRAAQLRAAQKAAFVSPGELWHRAMRPKHFTTAGAAQYGFQPRKKSYQIRKARRHGHTRPLVLTGHSERLARARDIRTSSKRMRVVMTMPAYFHKYRKDLSQPDKYAELTFVAPAEKHELAKDFDRALGAELANIRSTETTTSG